MRLLREPYAPPAIEEEALLERTVSGKLDPWSCLTAWELGVDGGCGAAQRRGSALPVARSSGPDRSHKLNGIGTFLGSIWW